MNSSKKTDYQSYVIGKIRKIRTEKKISQIALASELGISPGLLGNIESPKYPHKYTLKQISRIAKILNVEFVSLFFDKEPINLSTEEIINKIIEYS